MDYENPIDRIIQRFQHRWETDRQYRAAMSGVFGILLIVVLCSGVGLLDVTATNVLAAVGFQMPGSSTTSYSAQQNTDTGVVVGDVRQFPTAPISTWASQVTPPSSPIASSGTPQPTPTPTMTPTDVPTTGPCRTNCGGGGGGNAGNITFSANPSVWTAGETVDFMLHATTLSGAPAPGVKLAIIYGKWLDENNEQTDANGNYDSHTSVVSCPSGTTLTILVESFWSGTEKDFHPTVPCQ